MILFYLVILGGLVALTASVAHGKGRSPWRWGLLALAFGIFATIAVMIAGERVPTAPCPWCGAKKPLHTAVCMTCRRMMPGMREDQLEMRA